MRRSATARIRRSAISPARRLLDALEPRLLFSVTLDPLPPAYGSAITLPAGKSIVVPLTATNTLTGPVTYQVTASDPSLQPLLNSINPSVAATRTIVRFATSLGNMDFQLFNDVAPLTVAHLLSNLSSPDYTNSIFHRIIKDFVVQGGDRDGNGLDNNVGLALEEELDPRLIYANKGLLAEARTSTPGTGGSQFFITTGLDRSLDFNYTIFGQLLRGWSTLDAMNNLPTTGSTGNPADYPLTPPTLYSVSVLNDFTDAVLTLQSTSKTPLTGFITVTAKDSFGNQDVKTFNVSTFTDTTNDPPFLAPPSTVNRVIPPNATTTVLWGAATDIDGDAIGIAGQFNSAPAGTSAFFNADRTGIVLTTPAATSTPIIAQVFAYWPSNSNLQTSRIYTFTIDSRAHSADANNDGNVDLADYDLWYKHVGAPTLNGPGGGDYNYDGNVDLADYDKWYAQVGASPAIAASSTPSTAALQPAATTTDATTSATPTQTATASSLTAPEPTATALPETSPTQPLADIPLAVPPALQVLPPSASLFAPLSPLYIPVLTPSPATTTLDSSLTPTL